MKKFFNRFWAWYERYYLFNLSITTFLFAAQVFHLYWLFTDVVLFRLTGQSYFVFPGIWGVVSTFLDYSEIPAIISTSILYIHFLRQKFSYKNFFYLLFINIQWIHILWITDEIVVEKFNQNLDIFHWGLVASWIAIAIDYLELPVIIDTAKKLYLEIKNHS